MNNTQEKQRKSIFTFKNLFFFLIAMSLAQPMFNSLKKTIKETLSPNTHIGCLKINGVIYDSHYYVKQIHKFLKKSEIKALVLKINSPGGLPGAAQAILNELKKFKTKKPVVAMVQDLSASAAYYISVGADKIVANPSSLVGSIGVLMQLPNIKALLSSWNIEMKELQAGKFKTATSSFKEKTPEEIAYLNKIMSDSYDQFTKDVAEARNLDLAQREVWADGKIFTGNQALKLNLIDELGSISDVKETVAKLLIERDVEVVGKIKLVYPKRLTGLAKLMYEDVDDENNNNSMSVKIAGFISSVVEQVTLNKASEQIRLS